MGCPVVFRHVPGDCQLPRIHPRLSGWFVGQDYTLPGPVTKQWQNTYETIRPKVNWVHVRTSKMTEYGIGGIVENGDVRTTACKAIIIVSDPIVKEIAKNETLDMKLVVFPSGNPEETSRIYEKITQTEPNKTY